IGSQGLNDGSTTSCSFDHPFGLEIDAQNNIYIAEVLAGKIRKISTTLNTVTTIAGSGSSTFVQDGLPPLSSSFGAPHAFAVNNDGNIIIGDQGNQRLRLIDFSTNSVQTIAGTGTPGY